jgi:hypothetical protein
MQACGVGMQQLILERVTMTEDEILKKAEEIKTARQKDNRTNSFKNGTKFYIRWECRFQEYGCSSDQVVVNYSDIEEIVLRKIKEQS